MKSKIRVGLVEDHKVVRQGLVSLLEDENTLKVEFDVANGIEALEALKMNLVDVLLLDVEMPELDGRKTLEKVNSLYSDVSVIMFSAFSDITVVSECIALGAKGFLPKNCDYNKLLDAIMSVHENGFYFDELVTKALVSDIISNKTIEKDHEKNYLTPRELEIIQWICKGLRNKEIADHLHISTRTVEGHRQKITDKTQTKNVVDLVVYAINNGIYKIN